MKLFEVAWEAWVDSGIDVRQLRDSNRVGVYTGICGSEVWHPKPSSITLQTYSAKKGALSCLHMYTLLTLCFEDLAYTAYM